MITDWRGENSNSSPGVIEKGGAKTGGTGRVTGITGPTGGKRGGIGTETTGQGTAPPIPSHAGTRRTDQNLKDDPTIGPNNEDFIYSNVPYKLILAFIYNTQNGF